MHHQPTSAHLPSNLPSSRTTCLVCCFLVSIHLPCPGFERYLSLDSEILHIINTLDFYTSGSRVDHKSFNSLEARPTPSAASQHEIIGRIPSLSRTVKLRHLRTQQTLRDSTRRKKNETLHDLFWRVEALIVFRTRTHAHKHSSRTTT